MTTSSDSSRPQEIRPEKLLEVGRIGKAHGIKGEVGVRLISSRTERLAPQAVLYTPDGTLTVLSSRPHQDKFLVQFVGIDDRTTAETLKGTLLLAEPLAESSGELWAHELIGKHVVDQSGVDRGVVVAMVANPASDLLELDTGALVPLRFVVDPGGSNAATTGSGEQITVDVPEGLFELADPDN